MNRNIFIKGFSTGMILQLAIGPIFIYIINTAMQYGLMSGIFATAGATAADYLFITLALVGAGELLEKNKIKKTFSVISSFVLIVFGIMMIVKGIRFAHLAFGAGAPDGTALKSFASTLVLTLSSPLSIVFWTGVFTAKAADYSLDKKELLVFGFAAGLATFVFIGICVFILSSVQAMIPILVIRLLNVLVGAALAGYGVARLRKIRRIL
jgi:threonine/homoserine/homoserine lactone efflux protein